MVEFGDADMQNVSYQCMTVHFGNEMHSHSL
jgi:hypothetical protein